MASSANQEQEVDLKTAVKRWKDLNTTLTTVNSALKVLNNEYKAKMYPLKQQKYELETKMAQLTSPIYNYMRTNDIDDIAADNAIIRYSITKRGPSLTKDAIQIRLLEHFKDATAVKNMMNIIVDENDATETVKLKCLTKKK